MLKIVAQGRDAVRKGRFKTVQKAIDEVRKQIRLRRAAQSSVERFQDRIWIP